MSPFLSSVACMLLACAAPASTLAQVTLSPDVMSSDQAAAADRALELARLLPEKVARQRAATFIAYRLMMRGDCPEALPVMNRELIDVGDPLALDGLITGAETGRDPRCMAWVAARVHAVLSGASLLPAQAAELRLRGQTMFRLVGQMTRAAELPPADDELLEVVPEAWARREIAVDGLTLAIGIADPPTRLEVLLLDRLWHYRRTPLELQLASDLAARAVTDRKFLSKAGWVEVALVLLAAGERGKAGELLRDTAATYMSSAGLEAELALRRGDFERAATIVAGNEWGTKSKTVYALFAAKPELLIPYVQGPSVFTGSTADLYLVDFSERLDLAGYREAAQRAANAALPLFDKMNLAPGRKAEALARTGQFEAARALLSEAIQKPHRLDPRYVRLGIATGAAFAGSLPEIERTFAEAPLEQVDWLIAETLAQIAPTPSRARDFVEARLLARAVAGRVRVSAASLVAFAKAGLQTRVLVTLVEGLKRGRDGAALAIRVAHIAVGEGHRETAIALGEAVQRLLPSGPEADAELVGLSELYWRLGLPNEARATAMQVSHPVGQVDALSRALNPTHGEPRMKLSFQIF